MTEEKQNIAIYKLLGFEPRKMWRVWYNKDKSYGSCSLPSREEALKRIEIEKTSWGYKEWIEEYEFSEPEEYDDWSCCPKVDLDLLHKAEEMLPDMATDNSEADQLGFCETLAAVVGANWGSNNAYDMWLITHATATQRAKALLKTLNLWEE